MALLVHCCTLFAFWLLLSGELDAKHLVLGVLSSTAVALLARPMELVDSQGGERPDDSLHLGTTPWTRVFLYSVWLLRAVAVANWEVARIVLDPRLPIRPGFCRIPIRVRSDLGITLLANSITLTPGTITVEAAEGGVHEVLVHALVMSESVRDDVHGMEDRILSALGRFEAPV
jgi:multicomponent Na+:H+ antiporter subunit E